MPEQIIDWNQNMAQVIGSALSVTGSVVLQTGDIEIGAVEIKDADTARRAKLSAGSELIVTGSVNQGTDPWITMGSAYLMGTGSVQGNVAHDSVDAGAPVKIGAKAIDYTPDSEGEQGQSDVSASDRVDYAANLKGELIEGVKVEYTTLDAINTTYDDDPTTAVSASIDCWQYRQATLAFELDKANTPTDILFEVEVSMDGTNYTKLMNAFLADLRYDDTVVDTGIEEALTFPIGCQKIRVRVTATGTDGSNTFTVANATLYLRN